IGYGLRNIVDPLAALKEIRRVLRPGGRVVVLDFGKPDNRLAAAVYGAYLGVVMPAMGWLFHRDPQTYDYIPASLARYPAQRVGALVEARGRRQEEVRLEDHLVGLRGADRAADLPERRRPDLAVVVHLAVHVLRVVLRAVEAPQARRVRGAVRGGVPVRDAEV